MNKTVIIVLALVAVAVVAFLVLGKSKPAPVVSVAPPVSIPKQSNLYSAIGDAAKAAASAYATYEEYKD